VRLRAEDVPLASHIAAAGAIRESADATQPSSPIHAPRKDADTTADRWQSYQKMSIA